jgi:hypothetical protein
VEDRTEVLEITSTIFGGCGAEEEENTFTGCVEGEYLARMERANGRLQKAQRFLISSASTTADRT